MSAPDRAAPAAADRSTQLAEAVREAAAGGTPLTIAGGASKAFYGRRIAGRPLDVTGHTGIVNYEPTELVVTVRAGTRLADLEQSLAAEGQMLGFEPPHFGATATLGGTIACGLAGPRRPYAGAVRDFVLGVRLINGRGEHLRFGGEVMKNVAGYDVSRLVTGALGTLGVITEVSLRVVPEPASELTLVFECGAADAIRWMNEWAAQPWPLSAACHRHGQLRLRLAGADGAVQAAATSLGGDPEPAGGLFWAALREQRLDFFRDRAPLWRFAVAAAAAPIALPGDWLLDWGGAQRWWHGEADPRAPRAAAQAIDGHASLFRGGPRDSAVFSPLPSGLLALHRHLKQAFDPAGILNPGKMYADF